MNEEVIVKNNQEKVEKVIRGISEVSIIIMFTCLMAISSKIKIQTGIVPFTLQTFIVFLSSLYIGNRKAAIPQILYMLTGLGGAFIFANGGGMAYILSPTFGYILGFIACSFAMGLILEKTGKNISSLKLIMISFIGLFIYFSFGVTYLYVISKTIGITLFSAVVSGCVMFLAFDFIKILAACRNSKNIK